MCAGIQGSGTHAQSAGPVQSKFLALSDAERYWWFEGAVRTVSHLVGMSDKARGECVADWYLSDRDRKRRIIESAIAKNPGAGETTILLGLMTQACGPLVSK